MDQTKRPLFIPPQFATYAEQHGIFDMYKLLLEQLIVHRPDDPIAFLIEQLKKDNNDVPQIIILGPPSSGKTSIARLICSKLRTAHLTMENLVQEADIELRAQAIQYIEKKEAIPTEIWVQLIGDRVKLFDCVKKGWVLEGFPLTREQVQALQEIGVAPKHCVVLEAPDSVLTERAAGKRIDPTTGDIYHMTYDWPLNPDVLNRVRPVSGYSESVILDKMIMYHRHIDGILRCYNKAVKKINADQPKSDVFSQVFSFISCQTRTNAPHTPHIVLMGPTGSGKAMQAALLASKYNIVNVSCSNLINQAVTDETKLGLAAKGFVSKGMMIPDTIVMRILEQRLSQLDCVTRGWVLHGYPRTGEQAAELAKAGYNPNRQFFLDVPNDLVLERLTQQATDPITGDRYHMLYNPPRTPEIKERLKRYPRDREDEVRKRLAQYHAYVEEISDFYEDAQHVNVDQDPHTVFEAIESMIVNPLPKQLVPNPIE